MEKNEKGADRLSDLDDDLLISILSYVDGKTAAQTSVLSKRWMNLWAKVPVLDFDFKHLEVFRDQDDQNRFLDNFLARRDNLIKVSKLKLSFQFKPSEDLAHRIISYAIGHELEDLFLDFVIGDYDYDLSLNFSIFTSTTLSTLVLIYDFVDDNVVWDLPNLHTLELFLPRAYDMQPVPSHHLTCLPNLRTLGLSRWLLPSSLGLPNLTCIKLYNSLNFEDSKFFFSTLVNLGSLTLSLDEGIYEDIIVETPNLVHLNIIYPINRMIDDVVEGRCKIMISAPRVRSLSCVGLCPFIFEGLVYLDNVEIKLEDSDEISTIIPLGEFGQCRKVVTDMLLAVSSAKVLSLDFNILKVLSVLDRVIQSAPPVFRNLEYLKVPKSYEKLCNLRPSLRAYVLGFSPDAKIITEFSEKKGVEEVKRLKKDIADLKSKTINIMGKARHLDLEDLKQLEQILNEGLVSVMENKEQLLKAQLDRSKKKGQKAVVEKATLQRKIEELQGYLEDKVPREYSSLTEAAPTSSQDTGCQIKAGLREGCHFGVLFSTMSDAENTLPSSKKRTSGRQLTKETLGVDEDEENSEQETGTFKKASDDVLASRRIVKVRRQQPSAATSAASNPFAGIGLVRPTNSTDTPVVVTSMGQSVNSVSEETEVKNGLNQETEKEKDEGDKKLESNAVLVKNGVTQENVKGKAEEAGTESTVEDEKTKTEGKVEVDKTLQCSADEPQSADKPKTESMVTKEKNITVTDTTNAESTDVKTEGVDDTKNEAKANADDNEIEIKKTDNGDTVDVQKDGANPFSSFQQLSSNQNAFTGVTGSGFSSSTFSFGPIYKDGSTVDSGFSKSSFLSNLGASVANKGEGSRIMQEVTVETGEENEMSVFAADSVLFEFLDGGWKERGKGEIKVNVSSSGTGKARLVMRARGNYRLILNAGLYSEMKLTAMEKKGVTFACMNSNGEGTKDGLSTFALKFKDPSIAEEFQTVVTEHKGKTTTTGLKTPENSP